ncbi:hypothetical protein BC828DRAFT_375793 [Blastocladiella britannica]|nr:hypothetical protein BC828DRAFT_375793 [Blastocladiella britannica]
MSRYRHLLFARARTPLESRHQLFAHYDRSRKFSSLPPPPEPYESLRVTLTAFWANYGKYVNGYIAWSMLGSLALNVQWTRQERDDVEEAARYTIRKLKRTIDELERGTASRSASIAAHAVEHISRVPSDMGDGPSEQEVASWWSRMWSSADNSDPEPEATQAPPSDSNSLHMTAAAAAAKTLRENGKRRKVVGELV